jgi:hypothetical protein
MHWFGLFCEVLGCADGFRKPAEAQLRRQFREETGLTPNRFVLAPPDDGPAGIRFESDGAARVDAKLHGPDAYAFPVSIGWRCPGRERLLPSEADSCDGLQAWWRALPADKLRAQYGKSSAPPGLVQDLPFDPGRYSFKVDWEPLAWPDLWLRVETGERAAPAARDALLEALERTRESWNEAAQAGAGPGVIHNLGSQARVTGRRAIAIDVDFGSAGPKALVALLDAVQPLAERLGIRRVVVGGSP